MNFKYTVYTGQNKIINGRLDAVDKNLAVATLQRAGYKILSLKRSRKINIEDILPSLFAVRKIDVVLFSRQLAMLLEKGIGFLVAIQLAKDQIRNRVLKKRVESIIDDVESGGTYSESVRKYPDIFPATYFHMMNVGEKSGKLEIVLKEVAEHIEQDEATRKRIRGAFIYPGVILLMGIGTVVVLVTTVLPSLMKLFNQFQTELPLPTRITLAITGFITDYGLYVLGGLLLVILAVIVYSRTDAGRYFIERLIIRLPVVGHIIFMRNLQQFTRIATILLSAGLPINEVITVAQQGVQSETIRRELRKIPASLMQGYGLSHAMKESTLFPPMLVQMIVTGEETNSLEVSFETLSEHYDYEFTQSLNTFISLLEPVLIVCIGLFIGFIAISAMMPMYSIYDVMPG